MLTLAPALTGETTAPALLIFIFVALAVLGGAAWLAARTWRGGGGAARKAALH
jgi:hypothetical protein